ncbi:MAG: T9SS type A sorting domain-containing protein [Flavobacteriales bacterium]|nr:T9SS type A sorting domain-containing protein [Flavobacteriales bacterium]MCB9166593.1 T9SS type A sorting domain-containing protein [Flavobacteriales bacterium]
MRNLLLAFILAGTTIQVAGQCIPNPAYQDSVFGVWPDTLEGFAHANLNVFYSDTLNMKVPSDGGEIDPQFAGVFIDSVQFNGVSGLPPGLGILCNSQTPAPCTYLTNILGCGLIEGVPTQMGEFPLTFNVTAFTVVVGQTIGVPYQFTGYKIIVDPDNTGIAEVNGPVLDDVHNVPNPFADRTTIEFRLARAGAVHLKVFNLIGEQLREAEMYGKPGVNRMLFNADGLEDGIYLYKLEADRTSFTGRMVLHH